MKLYDSKLPLFSLHIPKSGGTSFRSALIKWFTKNNHQFVNYEIRPNIQIYARWFVERGVPQVFFGDNLFLHYKNHIKENIPNTIYKINFIQRLTKRPLCIHGHFSKEIDGMSLFDFYPDAKQFIAFVRDPLELHLSMFHYQQKLEQAGGTYFRGTKAPKIIRDLDEWLEDHNSNLLDFFPFEFSHENYKKTINDHFIHIGITEDIKSSLEVLADKLSKPTIEVEMLNVAERYQTPSESSMTKFKDRHQLEFKVYDYSKMLNK